MNIESMIELINPIADVLNMRLGLHTPKGKEARIVGLPNSQRIHPSSGIELNMAVKASYLGPKATAVLVRVKADLYIYVSYSSTTDIISLSVHNADKKPFTPTIINMIQGVHPNSALSFLDASLVKMMYKKRNDSLWIEHGDINAKSVVGG